MNGTQAPSQAAAASTLHLLGQVLDALEMPADSFSVSPPRNLHAGAGAILEVVQNAIDQSPMSRPLPPENKTPRPQRQPRVDEPPSMIEPLETSTPLSFTGNKTLESDPFCVAEEFSLSSLAYMRKYGLLDE